MTDFSAHGETPPRRLHGLAQTALLVILFAVFLTIAWLSGASNWLAWLDGTAEGGNSWNPVVPATAIALVGFALVARRGSVVWMVESVWRGCRAAAYWRGLLLLWSTNSAARVKGVAALDSLARRHPGGYQVPVTRRLCDFVRNPPERKGLSDDEWKGVLEEARSKPRVCAPEIMSAARAVGTLRANQSEKDKCGVEAGQRPDLSMVDLTNADLTGVDFTEANFAEANLIGTWLDNAILTDANLERAHFRRATLRDADLSRANLSRAWLEWADLSGANLDGANLQYARMEYARFGQANLMNADMSRAYLKKASLTSANLTNADLTHADLDWGSHIDANFGGANLKGAYLEGADLALANFKGANLKRANFKGAELEKADFSGAELDGANWEAASLEHAVGLTQEALRRARPTQAPASLPPGLFWPFEKGLDDRWHPKPG